MAGRRHCSYTGTMSGVDPYSYMHEVAMRLADMKDPAEIEDALDRMEYLFEVIPPEMQDNAETLIRLLRERLQAASGAETGNST